MSRDDATPPTDRRRPARHRRLAVPATVAVAALAGQMAAGTYTVQKGDTLWSLSQQYGTTVSAMAARNDIADPDLILIGQELEIPGRGGHPTPPPTTEPAPAPAADRPAAPAKPAPAQNDATSDPPADAPAPAAAAGSGPAAAAGGSHEVAPGDTLWSIAQANDTTVAVLRDVNDLEGNGVVVGQVIDLPSNGPAPAPANGPVPTPSPAAPAASAPAATSVSVVSIYRVQPGDTATRIAALFGVPVESLLRVNQISPRGEIEVGSYVRIPAV